MQNSDGQNTGITISVDDDDGDDDFVYFVLDGYMTPVGLPCFHYYWIQETQNHGSISHIDFC